LSNPNPQTSDDVGESEGEGEAFDDEDDAGDLFEQLPLVTFDNGRYTMNPTLNPGPYSLTPKSRTLLSKP
jgi:hypothetical protein